MGIVMIFGTEIMTHAWGSVFLLQFHIPNVRPFAIHHCAISGSYSTSEKRKKKICQVFSKGRISIGYFRGVEPKNREIFLGRCWAGESTYQMVTLSRSKNVKLKLNRIELKQICFGFRKRISFQWSVFFNIFTTNGLFLLWSLDNPVGP